MAELLPGEIPIDYRETIMPGRVRNIAVSTPKYTEQSKPLSLLASLVLAGLLVLALIVPLVLAIGKGFFHEGGLSGYWFGRLISNKVLIGQLINSLLLACLTTLVCLVL